MTAQSGEPDHPNVSGLAMPNIGVKSLPLLALIALGIVYGDIGTSPLYAFKVALTAGVASGIGIEQTAVGIASLIIWSLVVVVSVKYALLIMRADNRGEGGVIAMLALLGATTAAAGSSRRAAALLMLGLVGAALLYGDGAITPAISVLSAVEGLKVQAPALAHLVLPLTVAILVALFLVQSKGTGFIGRIFGPLMLCWFVAIAGLGVMAIARHPSVLVALLPSNALSFLVHAPVPVSFGVMGAVFLAVTGGEAMYADMGHFGRTAIRAAWFAVALPALILNYLGQAASVISDPGTITNPFYSLSPSWAHYPLVAFATVATIIASQAIVSGAFSLTHQSIQLGFLPRLAVFHTTRDERGQVYLPTVNWLLATVTIAAVLIFRTSDALAGAYGIAVSGLMAISTFLAALVARKWGFSLLLVLTVNGIFMIVDLLFFSANAIKLFDGGWFPLAIAGLIAFLMLTWRRGVQLVEGARAARRVGEAQFIASIVGRPVCRVDGTAVFLSASRTGIPLSLSTHLRHNKALQTKVLLVCVATEEIPVVDPANRAEIRVLSAGFERVTLRYGFMESPDIPAGLRVARCCASAADLADATYYIGRETVIADRKEPGMAWYREAFFIWMQRNVAPTGASFGISSDSLVELGTEIRI